MKKAGIGIGTMIVVLGLFACSPQIHLDFMGKRQIEEVELVKSRAKEKILLLDISGVIVTSMSQGIFEREGDLLSQVYYRLKKAAEDKVEE